MSRNEFITREVTRGVEPGWAMREADECEFFGIEYRTGGYFLHGVGEPIKSSEAYELVVEIESEAAS